MARNTKAYIALVYICIMWGTTYLAIRVGVRHYPPFLFAGVRQAAAGLLLIPAALYLNNKTDLSLKNILRQMLAGFLLLTVGNGLVSLAVKTIPSGVAALICSLMPIFAVLFNLAYAKRDRFNPTIAAGLLLGTCGVALIFRHNIEEVTKPAYLGGIFATLVATAGWALGSVLNKRNSNQVNPFFNSGLQLLAGGIFMLLISPAADDYSAFTLWNTEGFLCLLYLVVFGSALAFAAYMYSLSALPVGIATVYAYINPLIAVVAGYIFLQEDLNIYTGMAFIAIAFSVYLVNKGYRKQHKPAPGFTPSPIENAFPESIPVE